MNLRSMTLLGSILTLVVTVGEIALLVWLWQLIGWWVLAVMAGTSLLGTLLIRHEALKSWQQVREAMQTGALPAGETSDKLLKFAGAVLLIMPGFLGNVLGLVLLLPPARFVIRRSFGGRASRMFTKSSPPSNVIRGDVVDGDVHEGTLLPPLDPPHQPGEEERGR